MYVSGEFISHGEILGMVCDWWGVTFPSRGELKDDIWSE